MVKLNPTELQLHYYVADLLRHFAAPGVVWWHTPNGEARDKRTAAKLKRMGVRPGVWDFQFVLPWRTRRDPLSRRSQVAFLELKAKGEKLSEAQRKFQNDIVPRALFAIAHTPEEAQAILTEWGAITSKARAA